MRDYVDFCTADPVRYQLLFQRTIPGFEPSPATFEISVALLRSVAEWFSACGMERPGALDLFSALGSGIAAQQNSNEPGGDRWSRLVDDAAIMFVRTSWARSSSRRHERTAMNVTDTPVPEVRRIARPESTALAMTEFTRVVDLLSDLDHADWSRPTECPGWNVRAMAVHMLGMAQTFSAITPMARDLLAATRAAGDGPMIDALTALQIRRNAGLSAEALIAELAATGPKQARWRSRRQLMRHIPTKNDLPDGTVETGGSAIWST